MTPEEFDRAMTQAARQIRSLEKTVAELEAENARLHDQLQAQAQEAAGVVSEIAHALRWKK